MPSGDDAAAVDVLPDTATKSPLPYVTEYQAAADGKVLAVHVMPSDEVAATVPGDCATATNTPFPKVTEYQF